MIATCDIEIVINCRAIALQQHAEYSDFSRAVFRVDAPHEVSKFLSQTYCDAIVYLPRNRGLSRCS